MTSSLYTTPSKQYFTLISLINYNLTKLSTLQLSLQQSSDPSLQPQVDNLVVSTLSCLHASLNFLKAIEVAPELIKLHNIQNLKVEFIRIYYNLGKLLFGFTDNSDKAEDYLLKAIEICRTLPYLKPIELGILNLLVTNLITNNKLNLANSLIKDNLDESIELNASDQIYYLLILKIKLLLNSGEYYQILNNLDILEHHSKLNDHKDIMVLAKLYKIQTNFKLQNYAQIEFDLHTLQQYFDSNEVKNIKLEIYYLILIIQFNLICGNCDTAMSYLLKFHSKFETFIKLGNSGGNDVDFTLKKVSRVLPSGELAIMNPTLKFNWLTRKQLFILGYLISANCQLFDTSSDRSKIFLSEGLKAIDAELSNPSDVNNPETFQPTRNWLINIKALVLVQLADLYLVKNELLLAKQTLIHALELVNQNNLWGEFMIRICISWAFMLQCSNKLSDAMRMYEGLLELKGMHNSQKSLILLNKLAIVKSTGVAIKDDLAREYQELKNLVKTNKNSNLYKTFKLLELTGSGESVETKVKLTQLLNSSIASNNLPLQNQILLQISSQFHFTNPKFSEEMTRLSLKLSQFEDCHLLSLVNTQILIELEGLNNNNENGDRLKELELVKDYHLKGLKFKLDRVVKDLN